MKCTYCDCLWEGTEILRGWPYCKAHFNLLANKPIPNEIKGHESKYVMEKEYSSRTLLGDLRMSIGYKLKNLDE